MFGDTPGEAPVCIGTPTALLEVVSALDEISDE